MCYGIIMTMLLQMKMTPKMTMTLRDTDSADGHGDVGGDGADGDGDVGGENVFATPFAIVYVGCCVCHSTVVHHGLMHPGLILPMG